MISTRTKILVGITALALVIAIAVSIGGSGANTGLFLTAAAFAVGTYFNWKHDRDDA